MMRVGQIFIGIVGLLACVGGVQSASPAVSEDPLVGTVADEDAYPPLGHLVRRVNYFRDDKMVGERIFYKNGNVASERLFKDGKLDGKERLFYESGKLFSDRVYVAGKLDGDVHFFKEDGELFGVSKLAKGTGVLRQFGLLSLALSKSELPYKDGVLDGTKKLWSNFSGGRGIGCSISQYVNGLNEGWCVTFNEDGSLLESGYLHEGQGHSVMREYADGGKMALGYPQYRIKGKRVTEDEYREAAKTDRILAKTFDGDEEGVAWARKETETKW